jgi:aminopeptidase
MMDGVTPGALETLAENVVKKTLGLKRGETVLIEAWSNSLPYAEAIQLAARRAGAKPLILYESEPAYWEAVDGGMAKVIGDPPKAEWDALAASDAYVYFWGPSDRGRFRALPPKTRGDLTQFNGQWYAITGKKKVRACRMELGLAEPSNAESFGVDVGAWRAELLAASAADPAAMAAAARTVVGPLTKGRSLRIRHPNGTDLTLGLKHRPATVDDQRVDAQDLKAGNNVVNLPGGMLFVALDESVADGKLVATRPSRFDRGLQMLRGGTWEFAAGKIAKLRESPGGTFAGFYAAGAKGKERPGILEIGLNPAIKDAPNCEDQRLGLTTVYIGGNENYGGASKCPFQAGLMLEGATIEVDGRPIVKDGRFR